MESRTDTSGAARRPAHAGSAAKPSLAMLVSHDPTLDPRVDWEARSASGRFDVVVLGLQQGRAAPAAEEDAGGYRVRRLASARGAGTMLTFLLRWLRVIGWRERVAVLVFLVLAGWLLLLIPPIAAVLLALGALSEGARKALQERRERHAALRHAFQFAQHLDGGFAPVAVALWRELREGLRPAVVHCNDLDTLLVGVLARRAYGCRLVYDAHEFWPDSQPDAGWYYRRFFRFYERSLIRQCDAVITVNPMLARVMAAEYGLEQVLSVPNAVPWLGEVAARPGQISTLAGGRVKFLFQGRFAPGRGIEELIRAWRHIDGSKAALFLRGPRNALRDACEALARELGLLERSVYVLEPVAEGELVAASMEADVGLIPYLPIIVNHVYCCPNKLSQCLQAGLMILCNELPYVKQVLAEAGAGRWFDTRDEATVIAEVRRAVEDPALRERCGRSGRDYARRVFNWQQFYPLLESAYLGSPAASAPSRRII